MLRSSFDTEYTSYIHRNDIGRGVRGHTSHHTPHMHERAQRNAIGNARHNQNHNEPECPCSTKQYEYSAHQSVWVFSRAIVLT